MKRIALLLFIATIWVQSFSQPKTIIWQAPSYQDLGMKVCPVDSSAPAMVLEEYGNIYFDDWRGELRMYYDVRRRIKIFKESGIKYAHFEKVYYSGYDHFEEFAQVKGAVYTVQNGRPVKKKLKNKYIKNIKLGNGYYKLVIDYPDLKPGDIVEYRVVFTTFLFANPDPWYFQKEIPVRYSEFAVETPEFLRYYFNVTGQDQLAVYKADQGYTTISWTATYQDQIPDGLYYKGYRISGTYNFRFPALFYRFAMKNIPAFTPEPYLDNPKNYYYQVDPYLLYLSKETGYYDEQEVFLWEQFSKRLYTTLQQNYKPMTMQQAQMQFYPAGYIIFDARSWDKFAKSLRKDPLWGVQLKKFVNVLPTINQITKNLSTDQDKAIAIYNWVQKNIKWDSTFSAYPQKKLEKVLATKTGSSAEINMLLVYMLKQAKLDANPVLVKTVDKGHLIKDLAAYYQFNNTIAAVRTGNKLLLFDASQNTPWFRLPHPDHNQEGFLVAQDTSYFVQLQDPLRHKNAFTVRLDLGNPSSKAQIVHNLYGYPAFVDRNKGANNNFENADITLDSTRQSNTSISEFYSLDAKSICT